MNKKNLNELIRYAVVGGIATLAEWLIFFLLDRCHLHYMPATVIAYLLSTFVNWLSGRLLVFKQSRSPILKEIGGIYLISIGGLLLNLLIMWVAVDRLAFPEMIAKILSTTLVFLYNFTARKHFLYK